MGSKKFPIRILMSVSADVDNYNAQSLNVRDIVCRLDPQKFSCSLFYAKEPDPRMLDLSHVRLIKIPPRLGTLRMLAESLSGYDILFKPSLNRFGYLYFHLPRFLRRRTVTVEWIETSFSDLAKEVSFGAKKIFEDIYPKIDFHVATTHYVAKTTARDFKIDVSKVICTGVDTHLFTPPSGPRSSKPLQILFVGHMIERKGPVLVLKAATQFRGMRFVLVGERRGDFYKNLFRIVEEEQLTNVTFLTPMPQNRLAQLMKESDILLHPSRIEAPGKVIMEGAATGLPAIIFSQYRSPAVVDGVTGFQVETFEEMLDRLGLLIKDQSLCLKMGGEAITYIKKQFDWDVLVKKWEEVFQEVVSSRGYAH